MAFYKIISGASIIDVNTVFLKWQSKHDVLLVCDISEAHFIQSSDGGSVWRADWLNRLPDGFVSSRYYPVETIEAKEITEDEYNELKAQLEIDETVTETSEEEVGDAEENEQEENTTAETMSVVEMRLRIKELERTVSTLTEQITALTEKENAATA